MAGAKKEKKHIVVFQDEEGNVLKTSFVSHEEEAIPPELPKKKGESEHHEIKFQGWDQDISCVQGNLVVKAVYKVTWNRKCSIRSGGITAISSTKTKDSGTLLYF